MPSQPETAAHISTTTSIHLYGAVTADPHFHPGQDDTAQDWQTYGYVALARNQGTSDLTIFVQNAEQAAAIGRAFTYLAAQFPLPPAVPDTAHECGTPAAGALDTSDYPVPMAVFQHDPADPESWVYQCHAGHPSAFEGMTDSHGWQSGHYASEDDALEGAADHARTMHDGGLPAELAERVTAAKARAAAAHDDLIGRNVRRADDDSACPQVGTITAITADPERVMVSWVGRGGDPVVTMRENMDELTAAGGHWAVGK